MKTYEAKSEKEAVELAAKDLGKPAEEVEYFVVSDVKKLFGHKVTIGIFTIADVVEYAVNYLETVCEMLELPVHAEASLDDDIIKINIITDVAPRVIGKNGETLRSLNELTRSAIFNRFGGHYRILLNCDNYKDDKYAKLIRIAKHQAYEVKKTGITAVLDPMTSDERRVIHNALSSDPNITTVSEGTGHNRHLTIRRVERPNPTTEQPKAEEEVSEEVASENKEEE